MKKNNLRVLTAQLNGSAHMRIILSQSDGIRYNFLNERNIQDFCHRFRSGTGQNQPDRRIIKLPPQPQKRLIHAFQLLGVMSSVIGIQNLMLCLIYGRDLCCC